MSVQTRTRRGWVIPAAVASAAVVASLAMGTLGAYTATINGENNLAGSGTLTMSESLVVDGAVIEESTVDTENSPEGNNVINSDINRYGANGGDNLNMVPGDSVSTTVRIENTGEVTGALSLVVQDPVLGQVADGAFSEADPQADVSLADALQVTLVNEDGAEVYDGSLSDFAGGNRLEGALATNLVADETEDFIFTIAFPEGTTNPALMGQGVRQALTWTLTSDGAENQEVAE